MKRVFSLVLFSCILSCSSVFSSEQPLAKDGVIDLREATFDQTYRLEGEWLMKMGKLLSPKEDNRLFTKAPYPRRWQSGTFEPELGCATYKLLILLPKEHSRLRLAIPPVYCAYSLYLNGKLTASNGKVSESEKGYIPYWRYEESSVPQHIDSLWLTLQIANWSHSKGGSNNSIVLGSADKIALERNKNAAIDYMLAGALLMGGLFFLGLYLAGRRDKVIVFFALFLLVYSYRTIGIENYELHNIFPNLDWYFTIRIEYITLFMGVGLFTIYTYYLYPKDVGKVVSWGICAVAVLFSTIALFTDPLVYTWLINPFLLISLFCIVYATAVYVKAYVRRRPGSTYTLISALSLMLIFSLSLIRYWRLAEVDQSIIFASYLSFFFLQSLALSYRVSYLLKKAKLEAEMGLKAKSEFLSTMSHEIRTPLNAVIGMSHLLLKNNPSEQQKSQLDVLLFSASNLLFIVNDILDFNKIEAGKVNISNEVMEVKPILQNVIGGLERTAKEKNVMLIMKIDQQLKHAVFGDPNRLTQVISNLVQNAIKFTEKGYVEVNCQVVSQDPTQVELHFSVKDTGIGIPEDKKQLIFERFTQADSSTSRGFGGTGLGLAISKKLLELQGVNLSLESQVGEGSVFYFTQTFKKAGLLQLTNQRITPSENEKRLEGLQVLLVEDNMMNVIVAQSFLSRWGAQTDVAKNGQEALDMFVDGKHQLILMDLHMPVMDGYEASIRLRERGVQVPIIALTANLASEIEREVYECGINSIVVKPFLPDELFKAIFQFGLVVV